MYSHNLQSFRRCLFIGITAAFIAPVAAAATNIPEFTATALTGEQVGSKALLGQPAILIVTPSKDAAPETRRWAKALHKEIDIRIRDVIAMDLPFFISFDVALDKARDKIPEQYHDQAWLMEKKLLEKALGIPPESEDAYVFLLNAEGRIKARFTGKPTKSKVRKLENKIRALR